MELCSSCLTPSKKRQNLSLLCPEGHYFCPEETCAKAYISQIFSDPHIYYPGKCPICKSLFLQSDLENIMTKKQKKVFSEMEEKFGNDSKNEGRKSFEQRIEELAEEYSSVLKRMEMPEIIQEIIEMESQVFCPKCGLGGRKDLECTHVLCQKCQTTYCYVCGKSEANVDKQDEWDGMFSHNEYWETNKERCPIHLAEIASIDLRYSCREDEAMDLFHLLKIQKKIKEVFEILEFDEYDIETLQETMEDIMNKNNLDLMEIFKENFELIYRDFP